MKNLLTLSLLILLGFKSYSQTLVNKKDPFTGQVVKSSIVLLGSMLAPTGMFLSFAEDKGNRYITFVWSAPSGQNGAFNNSNVKDLSLLMKMDTDTILKFKADTITSKIGNVSNSSIMTIISPISDNELSYLSQHEISLLRIGIKDDVGVDLESTLFTKKNRKQVLKAASFILTK